MRQTATLWQPLSRRAQLDSATQRPGDCVGEVVVAARRMVDAVLTTARGAALKTDQLVSEPVVVEEIDGA